MLSVAPYHRKVRDHFKQQRKVWDFFAAAGTHQPPFRPDITSLLLGEEELLAFNTHEQARTQLLSLLDGELEVTDRILTAIAGAPADAGNAAYSETARLFRLYTAVYCDREALAVLGEPTPVISMLSKVAPAEAPVRTRALQCWQEKKEAAEPEIIEMIEGIPELHRLDIFSQTELAGLTRELLSYYLAPEWCQTAPVIQLARQYFPNLFEESAGTERVPRSAPVPATEPVPGSAPASDTEAVPGPEPVPDTGPVSNAMPASDRERINQMAAKMAPAHPGIKEYFAYVLLDFVLADPSLKEKSSQRATQLAGEMQLSAVYEPIANIVLKKD